MSDPRLDQLDIQDLSQAEKMELTALLEEKARRAANKRALFIKVGPDETKEEALNRVLKEQGLTKAQTRNWMHFYFCAPRART